MPLYLGPPARRVVLGLLLMEPGAFVRRDKIIDVLWGESPPSTAVGLVQAHVSRIRKLLNFRDYGSGNDAVIDSAGGAYRLRLAGTEADLLAFRELAAQATAARARGDDAAAVEDYERAVSLWRGEPFADVEPLSRHRGTIAIGQELTDVLLLYAEVARALGQHHRVLPRLRAIADAEPLNESVHANLMITLAGSGQQAAAIWVYQELRSRLDREFGLYPTAELAQAYAGVLRQDFRAGSQARPPARAQALPAPAAVIPRQLPAAQPHFTGRRGELGALSALAERDLVERDLVERDLAAANGVVIAALTGMAGIGKTALAVQCAHQVADRFPDGQLFINLRGSGPSGPPVPPIDAVRGFLTALGVPAAEIPPDTGRQAALYRSLVADRRMLIVLDNALGAEQLRPLLPGSPECLVLVTSRNRLAGLATADGAHLITLGVLTKAESRSLLASHLGAERTAAEPMAVSDLITLCCRLPLALRDAASRAAAQPGMPLAALVAEMRGARRRLDALETGEPVTSVRMVFSWSRARLGSSASRMFRLLGVHPGPDITIPAAASLAGLPPEEAYLALTELCDEHLLTEHAPGRYALHDLLRTYAAEEALTRENEYDRRSVIDRTLDHYLRAAITALRFIHPDRVQIARTSPQNGVTTEKIRGPRQAADWFEAEQHVLLALIRQAAEGSYAPYAWELPWITGWYFQGEAIWRRLATAQESALDVAAGLADLTGLAMASEHLGWLRFLLGDIVSAARHWDDAAELARHLDARQFRGLASLSRVYVQQSRDRIPCADGLLAAVKCRLTSDIKQLNAF